MLFFAFYFFLKWSNYAAMLGKFTYGTVKSHKTLKSPHKYNFLHKFKLINNFNNLM